MPLLDVNDAFDPSMLDRITVNRAVQTVDQHGRAMRTIQSYPNVAAVVAPVSPNDLKRLPEEQYFNKAIVVYSPGFRLQGIVMDAATGDETEPDQIIWHGSTFVVRAFDDYSGYGRGFTGVIAVSIDAIDGLPVAGRA